MAVLHAHPHSPSKAEHRFAEACQNLSSGWHVFFGVEWTRPGAQGEADHSGEMDAVLYHRDHGMLVIEVKGGGVRRDGDNWASLGRNGWHRIKNPLQQVRESAWYLIHEFKELGRHHPDEGYPLVSWALCFPDVEVKRDEWLGQDLHPHQILSRGDLSHLEKRAIELLSRAGHGLHRQNPTEWFETRLLERFHPCFSLMPPAHELLAEENEQMLQATAHQQQFLSAARSIARLAVEGCAGSGKSVLAADRARLLARDGESVLLVCYNRLLAERWRADPSLHGVTVSTFHEEARRWIEAARLEWPDLETLGIEDFEARIPELLAKAQARGVLGRYAAVVVDEGQDFRPEWWPLVEGFLETPFTDSFTIFFDPRQNLFDRALALPKDLPVFRLTVSVRNTRAIVDWIAKRTRFELSSDPLCPQGEEPVHRRWKQPADQSALLHEDLRELLVAGIEKERILVVACRSREHSGLREPPHGVPCGWSSPPDTWRPGRVNIDTAVRAKGLEADVVILVDVEKNTAADRIYAGATRAKHRLFVYERQE
jgi:hypothetical protein